jgi:hypothetical protein
MRAPGAMGKRRQITCNDCYFRQASLCALADGSPCPTFRPAKACLTPPAQAKLVTRGAERAHAAA